MRPGKTVPPLPDWRRSIIKAKSDAWLAMSWLSQHEIHGADSVCIDIITKLTYDIDALSGRLEEAYERIEFRMVHNESKPKTSY